MLVLMFSAAFVNGLFAFSRRTQAEVLESPFNFANLLRAALLGVVGIWGASRIVAAGGRGARVLFGKPQVYYLLYAVVAVISSTYSSQPVVTFGKAMEVFVAAVFMSAIMIVRRGSRNPAGYALGMWNYFLALVVILLLLIWSGVVVSPTTAFYPRPDAILPVQLTGSWLYVQTNNSGHLAAILAVVTLSRVIGSSGLRQQIFWSGPLALSLVTLLMVQARTSLFALLVVIPLLFWFHPTRFRLGLAALVVFVVTFIVALTLLYGPAVVAYVRRGQELELLLTATDRLVFWPLAFRVFMQAPVLGHGFYTGTRIEVSDYAGIELTNVDSTFLDAAVSVGLVGVIFLGAYLASLVLGLRNTLRQPAYRAAYPEVMGVLIILLFRVVAGPTIQYYYVTLVMVAVMGLMVGLPEVPQPPDVQETTAEVRPLGQRGSREL